MDVGSGGMERLGEDELGEDGVIELVGMPPAVEEVGRFDEGREDLNEEDGGEDDGGSIAIGGGERGEIAGEEEEAIEADGGGKGEGGLDGNIAVDEVLEEEDLDSEAGAEEEGGEGERPGGFDFQEPFQKNGPTGGGGGEEEKLEEDDKHEGGGASHAGRAAFYFRTLFQLFFRLIDRPGSRGDNAAVESAGIGYGDVGVLGAREDGFEGDG